MAEGNDEYTMLLLNCDGSDTHTTFTDTSAGGNGGVGHGTASITNQAQGDTAQQQFGTASLNLPSGRNDNIYFADNDDWDFGTGRFTIDFWLRFSTLPAAFTNDYMFRVYKDANEFYYGFVGIGGSWAFGFNNSGTQRTVSGGSAPSANTWYHYAIIRGWNNNNNTFVTTRGGSVMGTLTVTDSMPNCGTNFYIGSDEVPNQGMRGWIDEFRVSKGIARWTADFSASLPDEPYEEPPSGPASIAKVNSVEAASISKTYGVIYSDISKIHGVT